MSSYQGVLDWLLETDNPAVRHLTLRNVAAPPVIADLGAARRKAHAEGPISHVLANMHQDGYWEQPGPGYNPKYRSTVWSLILLSQLGAVAGEDGRIATACRLYAARRSEKYAWYSGEP